MASLKPPAAAPPRRRDSSSSTIKALLSTRQQAKKAASRTRITATLWIHDDNTSTEDVLIKDSLLEASVIREGDVVQISAIRSGHAAHSKTDESIAGERQQRHGSTTAQELEPRVLCVVRTQPPDAKQKQTSFEISLHSRLAVSSGFHSRDDVEIRAANVQDHTASHVELGFRDVYLARSDMWRMVGQELANKFIHVGQRITFLGSVRVNVKAIHVRGHRVAAAYFSRNTVPVFRSEAARYVIFIQMSREMWGFDSEGNGEILFNRVINGFLPDLFKRWTTLEVRHLVSIVIFGRQEYTQFDLEPQGTQLRPIGNPLPRRRLYQDFYKVVVTDMASAQWTTILDELKKNFKVFLRDVSLYPPEPSLDPTQDSGRLPKITGRLSTALRGNILEAINMASMQFANDYVDRDLIRTGISVVVVTAGAGVFEVDKELLNLTSENLTNNGIGIDIVCLAKMPLHSVPCFKYRTTSDGVHQPLADSNSIPGESPHHRDQVPAGLSAPTSFRGSPLFQSVNSESIHALSRLSSTLPAAGNDAWSYGIPHWVDLSYWAPAGPKSHHFALSTDNNKTAVNQRKEPFIPRVRMYEVQMMGLTEMGMADISIPWMSETQEREPHRRKRRKASKQQWQGSRSLSHSPKLSRRNLRPDSMSYREQGLLAAGTRLLGETFNKMDSYDETVFKPPATKKRVSSVAQDSANAQQKSAVASSPTSQNAVRPEQSKMSTSPLAVTRPRVSTMDSSTGSDGASGTLLSKQRSPEAARTARNVSYALRGLAPPMRATASTEINIENAQAQMQKAQTLKSRPTIATSAQSIRSLSSHNALPTSALHTTHLGSELSPVSSIAGSERPSTPIRISNPSKTVTGSNHGTADRDAKSVLSDEKRTTKKQAHQDNKNSGATSSGESTDEEYSDSDGISDILASSVAKSVLPFIRNVNASNPLKGNPNRESIFGRWQHLYPRKPRAATVKWRSLCTPASVPLTTEEFQSKDSLETEYDVTEYTVSLIDAEDAADRPESRDELLREMLSLRFAHGYQLVVGPRMNKFEGPGLHDTSFFFNPDAKRHDGQYLFMSMGITIQRLTLLDKTRIHVTRYQRKPLEEQKTLPKQISYESYVRTILAEQFKKQSIEVSGFAEQYPWEMADNYLANPKKQPDKEIQKLRFWRARFVLLPVEPPANAYRPTPADSEENEEEIHLRGIRALTQAWQKLRYIPPEDRRQASNRASAFKPKDRNPLSIRIETLNPSELVATELDKLVAAEEAGDVQTAQLLPEEEQFGRETAKLVKLASAIQGERGIEIKNRRWHLRLHYSCFHGEDLTNWLVQNVRDIDTREEAVEFGNQLMKEGLFEHVNSRHNFKDGNFFYSIKSEWRAPRAEARQSWFPASRRSDKSTPTTPAVEYSSKESPSAAARARSASNLATALTPASGDVLRSTPERKKLAVSLSKMMRLDVDVRKRSNRPEIVNLHYDRLHNPENCYHLELSWLNVTSKLVDDAVVSWTTTAERYGLKLVEVPIVEASKIPLNEPFRNAYRIKLVCPPPAHVPQANDNGNGNSFFTATSFTPQQPQRLDVHFYQKALLRRFNFVLDLEGMEEFPENVEINYSWGKHNYTYTQFVHRSGVLLAQITGEGDIILLANRLYNSRLASTKDTSTKIETSRQLNAAAQALRPLAQPHSGSRDGHMQASGLVGINVQSPAVSSTTNALGSPSPLLRPLPRPLLIPPTSAPSTTIGSTLASAANSTSSVPLANPLSRLHPSITTAATPVATPGTAPLPTQSSSTHCDPISTIFAPQPSTATAEPIDLHSQHVSADVFGPNRRTALATFITPEQIKDDLERLCTDRDALEAFYHEIQQLLLMQANTAVANGQHQQQQAQQQQGQLPSLPGTPLSLATDKDAAAAPLSAAEHQRRERERKRNSIVATGSSLLRPVAESELQGDEGGLNGNGGLSALSAIPEMRLPEGVQANRGGHGQHQQGTGGSGNGGGNASATGSTSRGWGLGLKRS